jgi:hypothetical protein
VWWRTAGSNSAVCSSKMRQRDANRSYQWSLPCALEQPLARLQAFNSARLQIALWEHIQNTFLHDCTDMPHTWDTPVEYVTCNTFGGTTVVREHYTAYKMTIKHTYTKNKRRLEGLKFIRPQKNQAFHKNQTRTQPKNKLARYKQNWQNHKDRPDEDSKCPWNVGKLTPD